MGVLEKTSSKKIFFGADNDAVIRIIVINVLVTAVLFFVRGVYQISNIDLAEYNNHITSRFVLPGLFTRAVESPWTLFSYMFVHLELLMLLANMLWLWSFAAIMQSLFGAGKTIPLYIYGGLAGAVVFLIFNNFIFTPGNNTLQSGASCAIMAIAVAITVAVPGYRLFPMLNGGIPLWVLTLLYVVISLTRVSGSNPAEYAALLGAAGIGYFYMFMLNKGKEPGKWMENAYNWFFDLFNPDKEPKRKADRNAFFYDTRGSRPFSKKPHLNQHRIDEILDKINQVGYNNLSAEEKELLKRAGEEEL